MTTPTIPFYPVTHDDGTNIVEALNNLVSAKRMPYVVADAFSTLESYDIGDYVIYENNIYRFTSAHSAGAWDSTQVVRVTVGEELEDLSENLDSIESNISAIDNSLAIVANSDTHIAISSGQYVYVKNHSTLPEGLYTANSSIGTDVALTTSNLTSVSSNNGGFNKINSSINVINSKFNLQNDQTGPSWQNAPTDNIYVYYYEGANTTTCKIPYAHCFVFVRKNSNDNRGIAYALRWDHNSPQIWICPKHDTWGDWRYIPSQNDFNIQTGTITSGSAGSIVEQIAKKSGKQCFIYINWTGTVDTSAGLHIATLPDGYRPVSGLCMSQVVAQLTTNDHFLLAYVGTDGKVWIRNRTGTSYADYFRMSFSFITS